jgi:hypothetical protein
MPEEATGPEWETPMIFRANAAETLDAPCAAPPEEVGDVRQEVAAQGAAERGL